MVAIAPTRRHGPRRHAPLREASPSTTTFRSPRSGVERTNAHPAIPPLLSAEQFEREVAPQLVAKFKLERWEEITFALDEEFLIDGILPKQGVGLLYGASQAFKSFVAIHTGLCLARALSWAGRRTERASVVYLAAEGAAGLPKRRQGLVEAGRAPPDGVDFGLLPAVPNLGTASGDCDLLIAAIESAGVKPGLIIIDTVAKVIGGADENGPGMAQFLVNAEALSSISAASSWPSITQDGTTTPKIVRADGPAFQLRSRC
jgi:RecA-family ATPase